MNEKTDKEDKLKRLQIRFFSLGAFLFLIIILWILFEFAINILPIINIIGFSILIAYLFTGIVDWLQKKTFLKKRGVAVAFVYLLISLLIGLFSMFVFPNLIDQIINFIKQIPYFLFKLKDFLLKLPFLSNIDLESFINLDSISQETSIFLADFSRNFLPKLLNFAFSTINFIIYFLSTIVLSIYFLLDGPRIWDFIVGLFSSNYKNHIENLRSDLDRCLKGYFVGQIQISCLSGLYMFIVYTALGSKFGLLLGIWQAIIEIIPVAGGIIGIVSGIIVIAFISPIKALIAFCLYMFYTQIIKDNFIVPRIMGNAINLHPVAILLIVLIGAQIGGLTGVIFAIPLAGLFNVILKYYLKIRYKKENKNKDFQQIEIKGVSLSKNKIAKKKFSKKDIKNEKI